MRRMTLPIDPVRKSPNLRSTDRPKVEGAESRLETDDDSLLPVPMPHPPAPSSGAPVSGGAVFSAQILGQDGQKRGLRGGPEVLGNARTTYVRTEYSGPADRRAPKGGAAKTEV
jgi:hypothetical protein